jgi:hypothetical protein
MMQVVVREKAGYSLQNPVWLWDKTSGAVHLIHTAQPGKSQVRATPHIHNLYTTKQHELNGSTRSLV